MRKINKKNNGSKVIVVTNQKNFNHNTTGCAGEGKMSHETSHDTRIANQI